MSPSLILTLLLILAAACAGTPVTLPPPVCERLSIEPTTGIDGYFDVTGESNCFPSPEDEGEGVYCVATNLDRDRVPSWRSPVASDGSCVMRIEAVGGDRITVHTRYPNGDESQPCYLVVP